MADMERQARSDVKQRTTRTSNTFLNPQEHAVLECVPSLTLKALSMFLLSFTPSFGWQSLACCRDPAANSALPRLAPPVMTQKGSGIWGEEILPVDTHNILIDSDMGLDDMATLAAVAVHKLPLCALITSAGLCRNAGHILARRCLDTLGLNKVPVIAGAEAHPIDRPMEDWELDYCQQLSQAQDVLDLAPPRPGNEVIVGTADMAADAIIRAGDQRQVDVFALGSLTNIAALATRDPEEFRRCVRRVVIVGSAMGQPYNVAVNPDAMRTLLRAARNVDVPILLIGRQCYAAVSWLETIFDDMLCQTDMFEDEEDAPLQSGQKMFKRLGCFNPHSMAFDPLALFFYLYPEEFAVPTPVAIRITSGEDWCVENCTADESDGIVLVPELAKKDKYEVFLRKTMGV